jgi:hypothetical protein
MSGQVGKGDQIYHPQNVKKYVGNPPYAVARSSWELILFRWCDNNPAVLEWCSEPLGIPYVDPVERGVNGTPKKRRYFPDAIAKIQDKNGDVITWLIEIKPEKETRPPSSGRTKSSKTKLYEAKTWATNSAKWRAAEEYCRRRGWYFRILTEKQLIQGRG